MVAEAFFFVERVAVFADLVVRLEVDLRAAGLAVEDFFFVDRFAVVLVPDLVVRVLALVDFLAVALVDRVDFLVEGFALAFVDRVDFLVEGFAVALVPRLAGVFLAGFLVVFFAVAIPVAPQ